MQDSQFQTPKFLHGFADIITPSSSCLLGDYSKQDDLGITVSPSLPPGIAPQPEPDSDSDMSVEEVDSN